VGRVLLLLPLGVIPSPHEVHGGVGDPLVGKLRFELGGVMGQESDAGGIVRLDVHVDVAAALDQGHFHFPQFFGIQFHRQTGERGFVVLDGFFELGGEMAHALLRLFGFYFHRIGFGRCERFGNFCLGRVLFASGVCVFGGFRVTLQQGDQGICPGCLGCGGSR